ncbi:MAG TPA: hypothetical protein VGL56_04130 [Fimbriimonadaceae bacterium]|jgi:tetratricopeptide (TPR) repeat protein
MMKPYGADWKAKDYATVVSEYDKVTVKEPALIPVLQFSYYTALIHADFNRALEVGKANKMTDYVAMLTANQTDLPKSDYDFAVDTLKDSPEMTKTSQMVGIVASAYFNDGQYAKALETIQKKIEMANKHGGYSDDDMKPLYDNLKKYKDAAAANPGK